MTSPDQHTEYARGVVGDDLAIRFHLTSRVFPPWTNQDVTAALPGLRRVIEKARAGEWDDPVEWLFIADGSIGTTTARKVFEGLNLWGFEESEVVAPTA